MKLVRLAAIAALFAVAACTSPTAPVLEAGTAAASMDGAGWNGGGTRMP